MTSAAERMRAHRRRILAGEIVVRAKVREVDFVEALKDVGLLPPDADPDPARLGRIVEQLIRDWIGSVTSNGTALDDPL